MDTIYYHGHCPDGWCAAFIASKRYPEAKLIPLDHGGVQLNPVHYEDRDVLMVDFSLRTREENDELAHRAKSFRILDHHKTAQAALTIECPYNDNKVTVSYATFDMKRSGAGLTWDYLFGKDATDLIYPDGSNFQEPRPWYVDYVEDRDLWNWKLPDSRAVCAYLGTLPLDAASWAHLDQKSAIDAATLGWGALAHIDHYVREAVKQAQVGVLQGYQTAVVNALYLNCSEIGNELAKDYPVSLTWFERHDGIIQFSLRSEGDIDVSAIAKVFNGGGHMHAAGFQLDLVHGRIVIDRILGRLRETNES
jgi:oligoribonuclease NrnB/cAMP/cGMP phosphodiesterase (DHH superfamily)